MRNYPTIQDIREARERLKPHIKRTPILRAEKIEKAVGCQLYLKPETLQITGAFKIRGALNKALSLPREAIANGLIATSSGNHAQGIAYAARMLGVKATLIDGAFHDVDSSVLAFEIASRACFREAAKKAGAQLLEPMMKVEVVTPEDYVGDVIGDLNSRRGQIQGQESRGVAVVINANVPLANMFKYVDNLRSMSQGRAQYTMTFDHYAPVPSNVAQEIQAKYSGQK